MTCVLATPCLLALRPDATRGGFVERLGQCCKPLFLDAEGLALRRLYWDLRWRFWTSGKFERPTGKLRSKTC